MPDNNLLQAFRPEGARFIEQQPGTAPGLVAPMTVTDADGNTVDKVVHAASGGGVEEIGGGVEGTVPRPQGPTAATTSVPPTPLSRRAPPWPAQRPTSRRARSPQDARRRRGPQRAGQPDPRAFLASGIEGLVARLR
ncbi:MAG: hypothetical protein V9G12_02255 [Microthrixaceae bacterium]